MTNPLVAERKDSTQAFSGVPIMESVDETKKAVESGDWAAGVMGAVGTGLDALTMALDPFGSILAAGVGWLMEHVGPLSDALDALTGDADQIKAHSETWKNVATELGEINTEMANMVNNDTASWVGAAGDAYRNRSEDTAKLIEAAQKAAEGASSGIGTAGEVVAAVRTLVRDIIAELVGRLISWALQVLATLGIAMAWVVPQVVAAVAKTVARIADVTTKLVKAMKSLGKLMKKLGDGFGDASKALKKIKGDQGPAAKVDSPAPNRSTGSGGPGPRGDSPASTRSMNNDDGVRSTPDGPASTRSQNANSDVTSHRDPQPTNSAGNNSGNSGAKPLTGKNSWGFKVEFKPDDVVSIPLKDKNGNVIGVSFPTKSSDGPTLSQWSGAPSRTSDASYFKNFQSSKPASPDGKTPAQPATGVNTGAPWKDPFYAHAHANPNEFAVEVKKPSFFGLGGDTQTVTVDGATHGKILSSNKYFQDASTANPNRDVVYMSCESASSSGNAAKSSSTVLHGLGHSGAVYAPTGTGHRLTRPDGSWSGYGVSADPAGGTGEFKRF
ncbi:hypothetical protein SAMN02982929_06300 [Saccharopolyspora kobensis]|uniref:WXG100 family type VII secretion target n=1 Tax=Saccharopolyspora kobensis TaxID=146035 RepID=A0A1H6EFM7_9PSEU|nr:hypothetical protein SAMN02982929_06300 [Saccharopolyspora kobensis]SFD22334.1 hypothetical protein SAMN05216506_103126 [Saccharopolyspora kobensis]